MKASDTNVAGTWAFKDGQALTNVSDSGAKTVIFTPADTAIYEGGETTLMLTVNRKAVTVTANDAGKVAGASDPALTATVTGLVGSDTHGERHTSSLFRQGMAYQRY